jgi:hypothetical protein
MDKDAVDGRFAGAVVIDACNRVSLSRPGHCRKTARTSYQRGFSHCEKPLEYPFMRWPMNTMRPRPGARSLKMVVIGVPRSVF